MWIVTGFDFFGQQRKEGEPGAFEERILLPNRHYTLGRGKDDGSNHRREAPAEAKALNSQNRAISKYECDLIVGRMPGATGSRLQIAAGSEGEGDGGANSDEDIPFAINDASLPPQLECSTVLRTKNARGLGLHLSECSGTDPTDDTLLASVSRSSGGPSTDSSAHRHPQRNAEDDDGLQDGRPPSPPPAAAGGSGSVLLPGFPPILNSKLKHPPDAPRLTFIKKNVGKNFALLEGELARTIGNALDRPDTWPPFENSSDETKKVPLKVDIRHGDIVRIGVRHALLFRWEPMIFGTHVKFTDPALGAQEQAALRLGLRTLSLRGRESPLPLTCFVTPSLNVVLHSSTSLPSTFKHAMYLSIPIVRSSYLTACMQLLESRDAAPNTPWTGWPLHESYTPTPPTPHEQNMEALLPLEGDAPEELSDRTIRKLATYLGILDWKEQQQQASGCDVDHVSDCPKAAQLRHCVRQKLHLLCMGHANVERLKGLTVLYAMTATDDEIDAEIGHVELTTLRLMGAVLHIKLFRPGFMRSEMDAAIQEISAGALKRYMPYTPSARGDSKSWIPDNGILLVLNAKMSEMDQMCAAAAADASNIRMYAPYFPAGRLSVLLYSAGIVRNNIVLGMSAREIFTLDTPTSAASHLAAAAAVPDSTTATGARGSTRSDCDKAPSRAEPDPRSSASPAPDGLAKEDAPSMAAAPPSSTKPVARRRLLRTGTASSTASKYNEPAFSMVDSQDPPSNQQASTSRYGAAHMSSTSAARETGPGASVHTAAVSASAPTAAHSRAASGLRRRLITGSAAQQRIAQAAGNSSGTASQRVSVIDEENEPRSRKFRRQLEAESRGDTLAMDLVSNDGAQQKQTHGVRASHTSCQRQQIGQDDSVPCAQRRTLVLATDRQAALTDREQASAEDGHAGVQQSRQSKAQFSKAIEAARKEVVEQTSAFDMEIITGVTKTQGGRGTLTKSRIVKKKQEQHVNTGIDELEIDLQAWRALDPETLRNEPKDSWVQVTQIPMIRTDRRRSQRPLTARYDPSIPDFKKFRRISTQQYRRPPVALELPEANDYGLGEAYYRRAEPTGGDFQMTAESGTQGRGASAMQKQNPKGRLVLNDSESGSDTEMAPPPPSCKRGEVASITKSPAELAATKRQCLGSVLSNDTDGDNTSTCSRSLAPARVEDAVGLGACGGSNNGKSTLRGQSVSETMESARSSASCGIIRRHAAAASAINAIDSDSDGETFKFSTTRSRIRPGATGSSSRTRAGRR